MNNEYSTVSVNDNVNVTLCYLIRSWCSSMCVCVRTSAKWHYFVRSSGGNWFVIDLRFLPNFSLLFQGTVRRVNSLQPLSENWEDTEGCVSPLATPFAFSAWILLSGVFSKASVWSSSLEGGQLGMSFYKWATSVINVLLSPDQDLDTEMLRDKAIHGENQSPTVAVKKLYNQTTSPSGYLPRNTYSHRLLNNPLRCTFNMWRL